MVKELIIKVHGIIGIDADEQHKNPEGFATTLKDISNIVENSKDFEVIKLEISSVGGSPAEALKIYSYLKSRKEKKVVEYTGISASAATLIGSVAELKDTYIADYLSILVHEARIPDTNAITYRQFEAEANELKTINLQMARVYSQLNGNNEEYNLEVMSENEGEGTLMIADVAKEKGFVGNIIKLNQKAAAIDYSKLDSNWSANHINKLKSLTNKKEMGIFEKKKPLKFQEIEGKTVAFRELKEGAEVEIAGSEELFSGQITEKNIKATIVDNKVTAVAEISEESKLNEKLNKLEASFDEKFTAYKEESNKTVEALKEQVVELTESLESANKVLAKAKLTKPEVVIPKTTIKENTEEKQLSAKDRIKAERRAK